MSGNESRTRPRSWINLRRRLRCRQECRRPLRWLSIAVAVYRHEDHETRAWHLPHMCSLVPLYSTITYTFNTFFFVQ